MLSLKQIKKQFLKRIFLSLMVFIFILITYLNLGFSNSLSAQVITNNPSDISIKNEKVKEIFNNINNFSFESNTISVDPTQTSLSPSDQNSPISNNDLELPQNRLPVENLLIIPDEPIQYDQATLSSVNKCTSSINLAVYRQAEAVTGVPFKALAAIHYLESNCDSNRSLVSGRAFGTVEPDIGKRCSSQDTGQGKPVPIGNGCGFRNLLDSAIYAGFHLKNSKFNGQIPRTVEDLAYAFGRYNGTGNRNCGRTPYPHCPPAFDNDDHIYAMSKYSKKHETMYLVYCGDREKCNPPRVFQRIGALTVIGILTQMGL